MTIDERDLRIDIYRDMSPTISMRVTHLPTGINVSETSAESQLEIKARLLARLQGRVQIASDIALDRTVSLPEAVRTITDTIDQSIEGAPKIAEAFRRTDLTEWKANHVTADDITLHTEWKPTEWRTWLSFNGKRDDIQLTLDETLELNGMFAPDKGDELLAWVERRLTSIR